MAESMETVQSTTPHSEKVPSCKSAMSDRGSALPESPLIAMEHSALTSYESALNISSSGPVLAPEITAARYHSWKHGIKRRRIGWKFMSGLVLVPMLLLIGNQSAEAQLAQPSLPTETAPPAMQTDASPQPSPSGSLPAIQPSPNPQVTSLPTVSSPTTVKSNVPTTPTTPQPTSTGQPTDAPSPLPTVVPSVNPSINPTATPSLEKASWAIGFFRQKYIVGNGRIFTEDEVVLFQEQFENYTTNLIRSDDVDVGRINTTCTVTGQLGLFRRYLGRRNSGGSYESDGRSLQGKFTVNEVDFSMSFLSLYANVSEFPDRFQNYLNDNLASVAVDLLELGLNVTVIERASRSGLTTPSPTITGSPSVNPTGAPTVTMRPSLVPSDFPSLTPSVRTNSPTFPPTPTPPEGGPFVPTGNSGISPRLSQTTVIVVSIGVAGAILLIGLLVYYRRRKLLQEMAFQTNAAHGSRKTGRPGIQVDEGSWGAAVRKPSGYDSSAPSGAAFHPGAAYNGHYSGKAQQLPSPGGMVSPSESLVSGQSLLSAGNSIGGDSGDEADATQNLADEFDQYKDQNLERMRADVEGSLTGFDGMMSQALTKVLIDDEEAPVEPSAIFWGAPTLTGCEIEASALGEVTDWLKRKENASIEER